MDLVLEIEISFEAPTIWLVASFLNYRGLGENFNFHLSPLNSIKFLLNKVTSEK